ncbi:MAG: DUF3696 domain-containing protein [Acidimicrobiales bacterium]
MFTKLWAENFKSWRSLGPIDLAPVTALFGTNSSGKTSILQILLLVKQTAESADRSQVLNLGDERTAIDLGSFNDLVFDHIGNAEIDFGFSWELDDQLKPKEPLLESEFLADSKTLTFWAEVAQGTGKTLEVRRLSYTNSGNSAVEISRSSQATSRKTSEYDMTAHVAGQNYLKRVVGRSWPLPPPIKCYGFPEEAIAYFQNAGFVKDLELELDRQFTGRVFYLGPLRSDPEREYRWKGTHPQDVGVTGEKAVEVLLASRDEPKSNFRTRGKTGKKSKLISLEVHVAQWLQELELVSNFDVRQLSLDSDIYRVSVRRTPHSPEVFLTDVGFGVSQVLPVLVLLASAPEGATVLLEQPEIHLHPSVQSGLADIIIETAIHRRVQVIVESHSEHLLRRLQLRTAEETIRPGDISLYFCDASTGESTIEALQLNLFGEISNWPTDFFGDPLKETASIVKAGIKRKRKIAYEAQ